DRWPLGLLTLVAAFFARRFHWHSGGGSRFCHSPTLQAIKAIDQPVISRLMLSIAATSEAKPKSLIPATTTCPISQRRSTASKFSAIGPGRQAASSAFAGATSVNHAASAIA